MTVCVDLSGNDRDGTYDTTLPAPNFVTGLLPAGGGTACAMSTLTPPGVAQTTVLMPEVPSGDAAWSFEVWVQLVDTGGSLPTSYLFYAVDDDSFVNLAITTGEGGFVSVDEGLGNSWAVNASDLGDFDPHYLAITYDGTDVLIYLDGVNLTLDVTGLPFSAAAYSLTQIGGFNGGHTCYATLDEPAWYDAELDAGRISAHFAAASVSGTAYESAVLVDSPWAYYSLAEADDDVPDVADPTEGPIVRLVTSRALVVPHQIQRWVLPIICKEHVLTGAGETIEMSQDVGEIRDYFLGLRRSGTPVVYQEGNRRHLVVVRDVSFPEGQAERWGIGRDGLQGLLMVTVDSTES